MTRRGFKINQMEMDRFFTDRYDHSSENLSQAISTAASDGSVLFGHLQGTVVGLRYYTGVVNQGEMVNLEREPYNPYDSNAVMVTNIYGDEVGHIKWELAAAMAHVMDNNLAEVKGVHYETENRYTMLLTLSFWGMEENRNDVIESMAHCGFIPEEIEMDRFFTDRYDHSSENLSQAISTAASDGSVLFGHLQGTVVGLRYYTGVVNQGEMVSLKREPYNPYDSNAVMVTNIYGDEVGHIKWELAEAMAHVMDNNLAEVKGVHYETKNRYTMLLTLSFWGMEENRNDVIESMAHCGFIPEEIEVDRFTDRYDHSSENFSQPDADDSVLFGHLQGTVVGLRYYTGVVNQGEMVNLEREPNNPYDYNAVMVTNIYGNQVGHIKRKLAAAMAYVMDNNLVEVEGVVYYGTKKKYTMPVTLSFWGMEENKNDVIDSMADCGFILKEMEPPSAQHYGQGRGYQAGGYGQPGNQRGSDEYYHCGWCGAQQ